MTKYKVLQRLWTPAGADNSKDAKTGAKLADINIDGGSGGGAGAKKTLDPSIVPIRTYVNNSSLRLEFFSVASNESAKFIPMDFKYSESFASEWNHVSVYGRNDPMSTFQGTKRTIKLSFVVGANSPANARLNMIELSNLVSLLYPTYFEDYLGREDASNKFASVGNATTIEAAPLFRVHMSNLIVDPSSIGDSAGMGVNASARNVGLVCAVGSMDVDPDFEKGVLISPSSSSGETLGWEKAVPSSDKLGGTRPAGSRIYPKSINVSMSLTVFHTFPLGYRRDPGSGSDTKTNSYARSKTGFGSFPWAEKHVYHSKDEGRGRGGKNRRSTRKKSKK